MLSPRSLRAARGPLTALAAAALDDTAMHLDALLTREPSFSVAASDQLRTPRTQVRLLLETGLVGDPAGVRAATEADGGRLVVTGIGGQTAFTLLLPAANSA